MPINCRVSNKRTGVNQKRAINKQKGQKIAELQKDLKSVDTFEDGIKNRMQDRMKFMSGKNAFRENARLEQMYKERDAIRAQLAGLQEEI